MTGMGALLILVKFFFKKVPIIQNRVRGIKTIERIPIFFGTRILVLLTFIN
jgi:hypothetical protein